MNISDFNYIESILWFSIALVILFHAIKWGRLNSYFSIQIISVIGFFCFGVSDIIEASTGAWWRPLWLLALKALCVLVLLYSFIQYLKIKRRNT